MPINGTFLDRLFRKTYTVRCPDGSTREVYKNPDKAFPLHIRGFQTKVTGTATSNLHLQAKIGTEFQSRIHGLLYQIDEKNNHLMISFRTVYVVYQADPCNHSSFLLDETRQITRRYQDLQAHVLLIDAFIELAKTNRENLSTLLDEFGKLQRKILSPDSAEIGAQFRAANDAATQLHN